MCQHCNTSNTHKNAQPKGLIDRIQHIRSAFDFINQPLVGFHRAGGTGIFTLTYAYEITNKATGLPLQFLRFDVTALADHTFDLLIADKDNNVLHEVNFANSLEVHDFIKSMVDIKEIPLAEGATPVNSINIAVKNGYEDNKDAIIAHLVEQDKTPLTVYLGLGGLVIDRHQTQVQTLGGHVH